MNIPPVWIKALGDGRTPDGRTIPVNVWGWGNDPAAAQAIAEERLQRLLARLSRGEPFPNKYGYGEVRPLREEILQTFPGNTPDAPLAIVTRNSYGAQVLNATRLLFLDIDFAPQPPTFMQRLMGLFGGGSGADKTEEAFLADLYAKLRLHGKATFRVYRTAAGFRVLAVDKEFDPAGQEAQALMVATGTDPAYARLCRAQRSFRARLTPKPWRCGSVAPPGQYPHLSDRRQQRFDDWLADYERAASGYATCRYLETIGRGKAMGTAVPLVERHDQLTRCHEPLPLA
jgi:hypothetical protein